MVRYGQQILVGYPGRQGSTALSESMIASAPSAPSYGTLPPAAGGGRTAAAALPGLRLSAPPWPRVYVVGWRALQMYRAPGSAPGGLYLALARGRPGRYTTRVGVPCPGRVRNRRAVGWKLENAPSVPPRLLLGRQA